MISEYYKNHWSDHCTCRTYSKSVFKRHWLSWWSAAVCVLRVCPGEYALPYMYIYYCLKWNVIIYSCLGGVWLYLWQRWCPLCGCYPWLQDWWQSSSSCVSIISERQGMSNDWKPLVSVVVYAHGIWQVTRYTRNWPLFEIVLIREVGGLLFLLYSIIIYRPLQASKTAC